MATVVIHRPTGQRYVVIGAGYGMFRSERPGIFFGNLAPEESAGTASLIAVAAANGLIGWIPSHEVAVESIDGKSPAEHLGFTPKPP